MNQAPVRHLARRLNTAAAIIGVWALPFFFCPAGAADYSEEAVKAAYLYRFAGYVDWPGEAADEGPFTIDVVGSPGIARELRRLLPGHSINGHAAQVREVTGNHDLGGARILYIAPAHEDLLRTLLPRSNNTSMLLVTDDNGGLSDGSAINFLTIDRNVRFEISLPAAERWGLKISSELLSVAIRVQGRPSDPAALRSRYAP